MAVIGFLTLPEVRAWSRGEDSTEKGDLKFPAKTKALAPVKITDTWRR
jgi:hypothetical protein